MSYVLGIFLTYINFAQLLGFLAFFVSLYAFSRTSDRQLRIGQAAQSVILALHFYLLGASTAATVSLLAVVRNFLSLHKKVKHVAIIFIVIYILVGIYTYKEFINIFPIISTLLGTTAVFYLSGIKMRLTMMLASLLWIIHNAVIISVGPLLMELFIFSVSAKTVYKLWQTKERSRDDNTLPPTE